MGPELLGGDTICAIASAVGGAIGVVRVSGPGAEAIARRLAPALPDEPHSHHQYLVAAVDPHSGEPLDEVLLCLMRAPRSYTGEAVVELQGHGGEANLRRLLAAVVRAGARLAMPGEFTRRAFLAGRLDLAQAEAVAEVIAARSERALRVAQAQLRGALTARLSELRAGMVAALAEVEAGVDFPDEGLDAALPAAVADQVAAAAHELAALAASFEGGRLLSEGIDCALVGRTNAGKSSLLNALAGQERVLVDAAPGTTRDFIEVGLELDGLQLTLVDTAGERGGAGPLEQRGLSLGRARRQRADVVVLVVDATVGYGDIEARLLDEITGDAGGRSHGRRLVLVWNKCDLQPAIAGLPEGVAALATSALTGHGVAELAAAVRAAAGDVGVEEGLTVTSVRQRDLLLQANSALERAVVGLRAGGPPELGAVDLRLALDRLGQITGETVDAEVLDRIFARFCIGK